VQIKATQTNRVSLYSKPDHLLVLRPLRSGSAEEVFNGPGELVWPFVSKVRKNGQCTISLAKLRRLMDGVPNESRLPSVG
jgi:hypothetical protein